MKTFPAALLLAALLAGCSNTSITEVPPRPVQTQSVVFAADHQRDVYSGEIRARWEAEIGFRVGGKIVERRVEVGDSVRKGQVLARLDPQDLTLAAEATQAQVAAAETDHQWARSELDRQKQLLDRGLSGQAAYDQALNAFKSAEARLEQARAQLAVSLNQAAYAELQADRDGVVTAVRAESGQVVAAGQPVVRLAQPEEKEIQINVPEGRIDALALNRQVSVGLWADPDARLIGSVREIAPGADPLTRTYPVKIALPAEAAAGLQLGMTARVSVPRQDGAIVALLPMTALYTHDGAPAVWVVDPESQRVTLRNIAIGEYREDGVTVLSGIEDGDLVVTAGVHRLLPEQRVRLAMLPSRG
jgi:membrane fusion protein, multidrug efflux system